MRRPATPGLPLLALLAGLSAVPAPAQPGPDTVAVAAPWHVSGLDPASDGYSFQRMEVAETLVDADAEGRLQPGLATDWEASADGLTWRFRLREGVRFHDGTPLDAAAAVASLRRAADRPGILQTVPLAGIGVPPLKWSPHWDRIIPFEEDRRWLGSETSRKRSS